MNIRDFAVVVAVVFLDCTVGVALKVFVFFFKYDKTVFFTGL